MKSAEDSALNEIIRAAEEEINETPEIRKKCLQTLRTLISEDESLNSRTDDEFLLRFLRARKFDCDRAFQLLQNYYHLKLKFIEVSSKYRPSELISALINDINYVLPQRDQHGRIVYIFQIGKWNPRVCTCAEVVYVYTICLELILKSDISQKCGIVAIGNYKDFTYHHLINIRMIDIKLAVAAIQNTFPIRLKAIHIVNQPYIFNIFYSMFYPFLSKKIKDRFHMHGSDLQSLHKHINPEILPEDFGGSQPPIDSSSFVNDILSFDNEFAEDGKYGYKRENKKK